MERHVKEVNALLPGRAIEDAESSSDEAEGEDGAWNGIEDAPVEPIDHEAEYIDEDKYTTVTVEEVDISRDGISKKGETDEVMVAERFVIADGIRTLSPSLRIPRDALRDQRRSLMPVRGH